ncbi:MAG: hypothetical protein ACWGSD_20150 [Thermodesulfobacteriota bacterium]
MNGIVAFEKPIYGGGTGHVNDDHLEPLVLLIPWFLLRKRTNKQDIERDFHEKA